VLVIVADPAAFLTVTVKFMFRSAISEASEMEFNRALALDDTVKLKDVLKFNVSTVAVLLMVETTPALTFPPNNAARTNKIANFAFMERNPQSLLS